MKTNIDYTTEFYEKIKPEYAAFNDRLPEYWHMTYHDRWQTMRYQGLPINGPQLLDIGAGMGRAMKYFEDFGFVVLGVEPSGLAISKSPVKDKIMEGYFEDTYFTPNTFDVLYIEQVLSHAPRYKEILKKAYSIAKPGAFLIVEEPNDGNDLQGEIVHQGLARPDYWKCEDHVNYGGHAFWESAIKEAGFTIHSSQATWPMEFFELAGDHYLGDDILGPLVHEKRYKMLSALTFTQRTILSECFAKIGIGRDVLIYARK